MKLLTLQSFLVILSTFRNVCNDQQSHGDSLNTFVNQVLYSPCLQYLRNERQACLQDAGQLTLEVIIWMAVVDSLILCPWVDDAHRCRDTVIGGPFLRGISGGERKRVSIGHEILTDPSLLFLDEPTSGLDSTTALRIIQVVKNIAQVHITLQALIHTGAPYPNCCIAMAASIDVTFSIFYFIKSSITQSFFFRG
jgi:hypothetical protein